MERFPSPDEEKLIVLRTLEALRRCTREQLESALLDEGLMETFQFYVALGELMQSGLIQETESPYGRLLRLTEAGSQSLSLFGDQIRPSIASKLDAALPARRARVKRELGSPASYLRTENGEYRLSLRAVEGEESILEIGLIVPDETHAGAFCRAWPEVSASIYHEILERLNRTEKDDRADAGTK